MNKKKVILVHPGAMLSTCYDILVAKDLESKYSWIKEETYQVEECPYLQRWLKNHPGYVYLGSEDLAHIPEVNAAVEDLIDRLLKDGFCQILVTNEGEL